MFNFAKFLFLFFVFSIFQPISSEISDEGKAFYAISSLRFFLESKLEGTSGEELFQEDDISQLWSNATNYSSSSDVMDARELYYQAEKYDIQEQAEECLAKSETLLRKAWKDLNPYLGRGNEDIIAKGVDPRSFLLAPHNHKYKILSRILPNLEILATPKSFAKAGFKTISERPSGMFVAKHPRLPGHLLKVYITSKKDKMNWEWCVFRCLGVNNIRQLIEEKGLQYFTVPKKKIYPISPIEENALQNNLVEMNVPAALIVTDMQLVTKSESREAWRVIPTKRHIEELYCILSHGFSSCCLPSNIPYTKDGTFTCIDTEVPQRVLPLDHVGRFLSPEMRDYWNYLVRTGGMGSRF